MRTAIPGASRSGSSSVNLYLLSYPSSVPAGQTVSITALMLDDLTPAPGILLTFDVYSPGNLADPSSFAGYTDANGKVTFTFKTSPTAGMNTVIIGNQSLGGDLRYASVRGTGGLVSQIVLASDPSPADGSTHCILKIWAKDSGGNPVKNEDLTINPQLYRELLGHDELQRLCGDRCGCVAVHRDRALRRLPHRTVSRRTVSYRMWPARR